MPRKLRIQYPGAMYHVMNRGDQREAIFRDDEDRQKFLATLGEACQKTEWQVHAYCLMSNHFHLVVETPQPNLVAGMKWLPGIYTRRVNRRHKGFRHLFSGRYKALNVDVRRVKALLGPHLVVSPSQETILPNVPPENVPALAEAALEPEPRP